MLDGDISCTGVDCAVSSIRVLKVGDVFYEYSRPPCVHRALYENPVLARSVSTGLMVCADLAKEAASTACCESGSESVSCTQFRYSGERVRQEAQKRCASQGLVLCRSFSEITSCRRSGSCDLLIQYWTSQSCELQAKIGLEGNVAIVHADGWPQPSNILKMVQQDTKVFFRVNWSSPNPFANYDIACENLGGSRDEFDNLCLCTANVRDPALFSSIPSKNDILGTLPNGLVFTDRVAFC